MKSGFRTTLTVVGLLGLLAAGTAARADTFGSGANQFTLEFVPISGATNPTDTSISGGYGIVNHDYRMGTYEITNDQWNKFTAIAGVPTGNEFYLGVPFGYRTGFYDIGTGTTTVPTNNVSWYECAQFVNWLNTSTGHQAAYKFTGAHDTGDYTFAPWSIGDSGYDASNPYRNALAYYFLPTEDEWVKAAYWNGTSLQQYATKAGESLTQGHGSGTGWNYYDNGSATDPYGSWNVGSGSQELNGTYDMMGNNWEWMESPWTSGDYGGDSLRGVRGGDWDDVSNAMQSSNPSYSTPVDETLKRGFRVASVPEPGSVTVLVCGAVAGMLWWRRRP